MSIKKSYVFGEKVFTPTCDECGEELPDCYDWDEAVESMHEQGWQSVKDDFGDWENLCPACYERQRTARAANDFAGLHS